MLKNSVKFLFKVSVKISRILDNTRDSFPTVLPMQSSSSSFLVCTSSATHRQQPPKRWVLGHTASTCWGFTTADDRQRLEAVIRRGIRSGFCSADQSPLSELVEPADHHLFNNIVCNSVLASSSQLIYELRPGRHNRSLITKVDTE